MKVSDFIVEFLIDQGVTDVFGYPGGMVTNLMESLSQRQDKIKSHVNYHEQGAAFSACGYAQATGRIGAAFATSGPGATNLITGICNAYFDSIPVIFITGQVNTFESKKEFGVRQKGFQETDIISLVKPVTKYCAYIDDAANTCYEFEKALYECREGRPGPVLLDIPMNIQKSEIDYEKVPHFSRSLSKKNNECEIKNVISELQRAKRPCFIFGAGIKAAGAEKIAGKVAEKFGIPVLTSMIASDTVSDLEEYYGFIGAYGNRTANFIAAKSDLIISVGSRLDVRQIGGKRAGFAPGARLIRIDIDNNEFHNKVKDDELDICIDAKTFLKQLYDYEDIFPDRLQEWRSVCNEIRKILSGKDCMSANIYIQKLSEKLPDNIIITTDVGQNQVWVAQSFRKKSNQKILFSGGHGAMGYSLPAAIGAAAGTGKAVVSFNGDGGIQMNIQELQFVVREQQPVTIIIFNNYALGMIRHFQELYFDSNFFQTTVEQGYSVPDFEMIANAYGLHYNSISSIEECEKLQIDVNRPGIIEIKMKESTYVTPKLEFGKPNQDQEPLLERATYDYIMKL